MLCCHSYFVFKVQYFAFFAFFFLEWLFQLLWYSIIISVGCFWGSIPELKLKCLLRNCCVQLFPSPARTYMQTELSNYIKPAYYTGAWLRHWGRAVSVCMTPKEPQYVNTSFCFSYVKPELQSYKESEDKNLLFHRAVIYGLSLSMGFWSKNDVASTIQDTPG